MFTLKFGSYERVSRYLVLHVPKVHVKMVVYLHKIRKG